MHPGPRAQKELREARRPQVQAVTTGLPRAMVLRLIRALPGEPSRLPPSPRGSIRASRPGRAPRNVTQDLAPRPWGARTTRLRRPRTSPPDAQATASLAIRRRILMETFFKRRSSCTPVDRSRPSRPATPCAHDALASTASPAQRVVTFARRPSGGPGWRQAKHDLRKYERGIFLREGLDSPDRLEWKSEIRFSAHATLAGRRKRKRRSRRNLN